MVRVWDPRTGSKNMKLRGHTDNIRALLLDATGRLVKRICIMYLDAVASHDFDVTVYPIIH